MTPNELRGEFAIVLDGAEYGLRPTHEAMLSWEAKLGASTVKLARAAFTGDLMLAQAATVVTECIKAWGRQTGDATSANVGEKVLGDLIHREGLLDVIKKLQTVLALASTGGVTASGEPKPDAQPPAPKTESANPAGGESDAA